MEMKCQKSLAELVKTLTELVSQISGLTGEELHQCTSEMYSYPVSYYGHSFYAGQQEECKRERKFTHPAFLLQVTGLPLFCSENCQQKTTTRLETAYSVM
jgi:hypothetical protein